MLRVIMENRVVHLVAGLGNLTSFSNLNRQVVRFPVS